MFTVKTLEEVVDQALIKYYREKVARLEKERDALRAELDALALKNTGGGPYDSDAFRQLCELEQLILKLGGGRPGSCIHVDAGPLGARLSIRQVAPSEGIAALLEGRGDAATWSRIDELESAILELAPGSCYADDIRERCR